MRCTTCGDTPHPGFVPWREVEIRDVLFRRDLVPCPDCGGFLMTSCNDGAVGGRYEMVNIGTRVQSEG